MITNQDLMKLFGHNIKQLRRQLSLSQQQLADLLDMERSHLVAIEGGKKATSFNTLVKLSNIFKCSVAQFFSNSQASSKDEVTNSLKEFARDYRMIKNAITQARTSEKDHNPIGVHKVSYELLTLIPLLSEQAQGLVQKFAEGYLSITKSEDPLVEQIIHDILSQQKATANHQEQLETVAIKPN